MARGIGRLYPGLRCIVSGPAVVLLAVVLPGTMPTLAQQATPGSGWQTGTDVMMVPDGPPAPRPATPNTTVVPRSTPASRLPSSQSEVALVAFLTDDGQRIEQGLVWRIFQEPAPDPQRADRGRPRLVNTLREASPAVRLAPGKYIVNVAFGRAHLTRKLTLAAGNSTQERFVLNAGGLRLSALIGKGQKAPDTAVTYDVLSGDVDQSGNRAKIVSGAKTGVIVRLNAGIYQIVSTYGDANAIVRADVSVEAGKLTEATVNHHGVKVTFKLVTRAGGEALADTQWSLYTSNGELIRESVGAVPTHILAAGNYVVSARNSVTGRVYQRTFNVQDAESAQVEVVMQ
jgi:hypothetical protein